MVSRHKASEQEEALPSEVIGRKGGRFVYKKTKWEG